MANVTTRSQASNAGQSSDTAAGDQPTQFSSASGQASGNAPIPTQTTEYDPAEGPPTFPGVTASIAELQLYAERMDRHDSYTNAENIRLARVLSALTSGSIPTPAASAPEVLKKPIIKTQGKEPDVYEGNATYEVYDNYVKQMQRQLILNNVWSRDDMHTEKVTYAVTYLGAVPQSQWSAHEESYVRSNTPYTWTDYVKFLALNTTENPHTFQQKCMTRWYRAKQEPEQTIPQYVAYLERLEAFLEPKFQHNEVAMMTKLLESVSDELQAECVNNVPIQEATKYADLKRLLIDQENGLEAKRKLWKNSRRNKRNRSLGDDEDEREYQSRRSRRNNRGRGLGQNNNRGGYQGNGQDNGRRGHRNNGRGRGQRNNQRGNQRGRGRGRGRGGHPATGSNTINNNNDNAAEQAKRQKTYRERQDKGACLRCGSMEHWIKDCPEPEESKN